MNKMSNFNKAQTDMINDVNLKYFKPNVTKEDKPEEINLRESSVLILELFEQVLSKHNIMIPDEDRVGDDDEACIYGMTYCELEEGITSVLEDLVNMVKSEPDLPINTDTL